MDEDILKLFFALQDLEDQEEEEAHLARRRRRRRIWVQKWFENRSAYSHTRIIAEFQQSPHHFKTYLRISRENYDMLLNLVTPLITKKDTHLRLSVTPHEKLSTTLAYLSSGLTLTKLSTYVNIHKSTISLFLRETLKAIIMVLHDKVRLPQTESEWRTIAQRFEEKHRFPNCVGAVDGKHVQIARPPNSGSTFFNYLRYYSIVLLAIVGPDGELLYQNIGSSGSQSDAGIFRSSRFHHLLNTDQLNIPAPEINGGIELPFVILADSGFALERNVMNPFRGRQANSVEKRVYNTRLSSARRVVENYFGHLTKRFRIFSTPIDLDLATISDVVEATGLIHNFLLQKNDQVYGTVRQCNFAHNNPIPAAGAQLQGRTLNSAQEIRLRFVNYFQKNI